MVDKLIEDYKGKIKWHQAMKTRGSSNMFSPYYHQKKIERFSLVVKALEEYKRNHAAAECTAAAYEGGEF